MKSYIVSACKANGAGFQIYYFKDKGSALEKKAELLATLPASYDVYLTRGE